MLTKILNATPADPTAGLGVESFIQATDNTMFEIEESLHAVAKLLELASLGECHVESRVTLGASQALVLLVALGAHVRESAGNARFAAANHARIAAMRENIVWVEPRRERKAAAGSGKTRKPATRRRAKAAA